MTAPMVWIVRLQRCLAVVIEADETRRAIDPDRPVVEEVAGGQAGTHAGEDAVDAGLIEGDPG